MFTYDVIIDDKKIDIHEARVSAYPFNKVWDGKQRSISQTEIAYFVTVDIDKPTNIHISIKENFDSYEIRPLKLNLKHVRNGNEIDVKVTEPCQFTVEPDGTHFALHVFVNPISTTPCGENVIYYGPGKHEAGLIWLESDSELYIAEGAVVHGVIYAKDSQNIKISGRGILDSSGYARGNESDADQTIAEQMRLKGINEDFHEGLICSNLVLYNCRNVTVEGIILRDAMFWAVITRNGCENIVMDNMKLIGHWRYNSDGIDICASRNVTVKNSFIRSFDDCFVVRGAYLPEETEDVENVTIENCVLWCDWGKSLEIWCGDRPNIIRNIIHKNNYLIHLNALAISISTWYGSKKSLIEDVVYENIFIDGDMSYPNLQIESEKHPEYIFGEEHTPFILRMNAEHIGKNLGNQKYEPAKNTDDFNILYQNISFKNVQCDDPNLLVLIQEQENLLEIKNVTAENCCFEI